MASHANANMTEAVPSADSDIIKEKVFRSKNKGLKGRGKPKAASDAPREKPVPGPISAPLKLDPDNRLKPKALCTSSSAYKNDPMWQDFEMEGFDGLTAYQPKCQFAVTFEGLQGLIDRTYDAMNSADSHFAKFVSRSMYSYYIWQHAYARIIAIKAHTGEESHVEDRFHQFMRNETYPVSSVIEEYLSAIGTTTDNTGVEFRLKISSMATLAVSYDTHYLYESLAAPQVAELRVVRDLHYTIDPQQPKNWDLPDELRSAEQNAGLSTRNLLGWAPAVALATEQSQLLEAAGAYRSIARV